MKNKKFKTEDEIISWLTMYKIDDYTINPDLTVDINNEVNLKFKGLKSLPVNFRSVTGNFHCNGNKFKNLDGCPKEVGGSFDCSNNQLSSLKGGPKKVKGFFDCANNRLNSLQYFPKEIGDFVDVSYNNVSSLSEIGINTKIGGDFYVVETNLKSIDSLISNVSGDLIFSKLNCHVTEKIAGNLFMLESKILQINIKANKLNYMLVKDNNKLTNTFKI